MPRITLRRALAALAALAVAAALLASAGPVSAISTTDTTRASVHPCTSTTKQTSNRTHLLNHMRCDPPPGRRVFLTASVDLGASYDR